MSIGIRLTVFFWNCNISKVWHQIISLYVSFQRSWRVLSFRGTKCLVWVQHIRVMGLWSWSKNNHILTAIGQFSKILFSEKQFSNILQNTIFFQAITFFKKASEIQGKIFRFFFQKKTFRRGLGGARPELEWSSRGARAELGRSLGGVRAVARSAPPPRTLS